jgi:hypothetical protein
MKISRGEGGPDGQEQQGKREQGLFHARDGPEKQG